MKLLSPATIMVLGGALGACGSTIAETKAEIPIPAVPVTFERRLLSASGCEYLGPALSQEQVREVGGNLILVFIETRSTFVTEQRQSSNMVLRQTTTYRGEKGVAFDCPENIRRDIIAVGWAQ